MTITIDRTINSFNIEALIQNLEGDAGIFIVLLGLTKNKKEQIISYHIGVFDSYFRGLPSTHEALINCNKMERSRTFFKFDNAYKVHFHNTKNFYYSTLQKNEELIDLKEAIIEGQIRKYMESGGWYNSRTEEELEKIARNYFSEELMNSCIKKIERESEFLMNTGRIGRQLAQKQIKIKDLEEMFAPEEECSDDKIDQLFRVMQKIFPEKEVRDYIPTKKELILPEHTIFPLISTRNNVFEPISEYY